MAAALLITLGAAMSAAPARADTDTIDLNMPAIALKAPDKVMLDAIAMAGNRIVAAGVHGAIVYSDDDGATWHQASVPVSVLLTSLSFATPQVGWAVGHDGVILHTQDGGKTWQKQLDGNEVNTLALQAEQAAAAQNLNLPTMELAARRATLFQEQGADKPFLSVLALGPQSVLAVGAYRMADFSADGGKSWQDRDLYIADRLSHNLYDIAPVNGALYITGETGLVFRSTDQGQTFTQVTSPGPATLFGVLGTKDGGLLVYGVAGNAYLSHDNGQSWQSLAVCGNGTDITAGLVLQSGAVLLGTAAGGLFISYDNGQHFQPVPVIVPLSIAALAQTPDGHVVLSGIGGIKLLPASTFAAAPPEK